MNVPDAVRRVVAEQHRLYDELAESTDLDFRHLTRNRASAFCPACGRRVDGQFCAVRIHLVDHNVKGLSE